MEVTLSNREILNAIMSNSIKELMKVSFSDIKISWDIMKNVEKLEVISNRYLKLERELINQYALKDNNGNIKADEKGNPEFPPHSEFYTKQGELLNFNETIDIKQLKLSCLQGSSLSPAILYDLKFMINDDE